MLNKKFLLTILSYALIMLFLGPLIGVLHQESSKKLSFIKFTDNEISSISASSLFDIEELKPALKAKEKAEEIYLEKLKNKNVKEQINLILDNKTIRTHFLTYYRQNKSALPNSKLSDEIDNTSKINEFHCAKKILQLSLKLPETRELDEFEISVAKDFLAKVHGHAILIGTVIPVMMCIILWFTYQLGGTPITDRSLKVVSITYISSSIVTISLMLIKGYSYNISVRHGVTDFNEMGEYIISSHSLKAALYGITHTVTFVSLYYFIFKVFQSLNNRADITEEQIIAKKMRMIYINGILWVGIGALLIYRGLGFFPEKSSPTFYIALLAGLILGGAKGYFVLGKTSKRNVNRITQLQKPVQYTSTIPIMLFLLVPIMIAFGITLRSYKDTIWGGGYTVGAVYVGIGAALFFASLFYWKANLKKKV